MFSLAAIRMVTRVDRLACAAIAVFAIASVPPAFGQPDKSASWYLEPCQGSAQAARKSCDFEADSDYWLAIGICGNLPNETRRQRCASAAERERDDAGELCADQLGAREDVCEALGQAAYHPAINPANFVRRIDNRFMPLKPGSTRIYRADTDEGVERVTVTVKSVTEEILGVPCTVVRDRVTLDGEVIEDTIDWFAQDRSGNVWYFGEISREFEDGRLVGLEGSWRAGVDGAKPGIVMKASPRIGDVYRQEFFLGEAEDVAEIVSLSGRATVPAAACTNCLVTRDFTPIEPEADERKYYKAGIGLILEVKPRTGERLELISVQQN